MKLWEGYARGIGDECNGLLVAENEEQALGKWKKYIADNGGWYASESVHEVKEVDGYKIVFRKGKKIVLEEN